MRDARGSAKLARVLDRHVQRRAQRKSVIELGTIEAGLNLLLDSMSVPIPPSDYLVDARFASRTSTESSISNPTTDADFRAHEHEITSALVVGDRVVCVLLDADSDEATPIVIGRLA